MTDSNVILNAQLGSEQALEELISFWYRPILTFCYRRTLNQMTAEDITQNVFFKMTKSLALYHDKGQFKSWLFSIAVNACNDYYRKNHNFELVSEEEIEFAKISATEIYEQIELKGIIDEALRKLPVQQREVVVLHYLDGFSLKEISKLISCPQNTIKSRLYRALVSMREMIGKDVFVNES
ncbi:MAG: RNA polymerase sigma factor [Oscillospiraceae bacterium]